MWGIGTQHTIMVKPAYGEARERTGEVFAHRNGDALLQVRAPGTPAWPYTVTMPQKETSS